MKLFVSLMLCLFYSQITYSQNLISDYEQEVRKSLKTVQIQNFKGKYLNTFLETDIVCEYESYFFSDEPPAKLSSLVLVYAKKTYVRVYFKELKYQKRFSATMHWSFEKLRKETIERVELEFN